MSLIFGGMLGGLGAGVAAAGATIGRDAQIEQDRLLRSREREEDRELRREIALQNDTRYRDLANQNEQLRRDISAGKSGSSGGGKGVGQFSPVEGSQDEAILAADMKLSVPELRTFLKAHGGDTSAIAQDQVVEDESGGHTAKALPPGFDKFMEAKRADFARSMKTLRFGKDAKDVADAEGVRVETDVKETIRDAKGEADIAAGGMKRAAQEGKGLYEGDATGSTQKFTGKQTQNELGKAKVGTERSAQGENAAQAGAAKAAGRASDALADKRRAGGDDNVMTNDQLNRAMETARKALKDAREAGDKEAGKEHQARLSRLQAEQDNRAAGKKDEKSADSGKPAPKVGSSPFAEGQRIKDKNGKIYVVRNGKPVAE